MGIAASRNNNVIINYRLLSFSGSNDPAFVSQCVRNTRESVLVPDTKLHMKTKHQHRCLIIGDAGLSYSNETQVHYHDSKSIM